MSSLFNLNLTKYKLKNGLEIILYPDSTTPLISLNIWYKAGSANEEKGKTGLAHLFEHMMFQGSKNVPKEMHFKYIQEAGGSLNGSTSLDRTNYYETLPSNFLELALWLESDRMGYFLDTLTEEKLQNQKDVVMNERRQNYDNQPYGLAWEKMFNMLYPESHPYHFPTIGLIEDIEKFDLPEVKNFFMKYYSPANACLVLTGDFDIKEVQDLISRYFEEIPNLGTPETPSNSLVKLSENKFMSYEDNVQLARIYLGFHSPLPFTSEDSACDLLSYILSTAKSSRLFNRLVYDDQTALDVSSFQFSAKYGGTFFIAASAKPGVLLNDLKSIIFEEINNLIKNGINEKELTMAKNSTISNYFYSLQNLSSIANSINLFNFYIGKPDSFKYDVDRIKNLTSEDIVNAARKYLTQNYVELQIIPRQI